MISRRGLLGGLLALPLVGWVVPKTVTGTWETGTYQWTSPVYEGPIHSRISPELLAIDAQISDTAFLNLLTKEV